MDRFSKRRRRYELYVERKRYRGAVLFAQQAVEKIIKGYIVENRSKSPRRIHAIEELIKDAGLDVSEIEIQI